MQTNDGATRHNVWTKRYLATGSDVGSLGASNIIPLLADDTVEVWIQNVTDGTDATFDFISLSVIQVGGTHP